MTITKIGRCKDCASLDFLNRDGSCEWCLDTETIVYATGMIKAATPPSPADEPEAA